MQLKNLKVAPAAIGLWYRRAEALKAGTEDATVAQFPLKMAEFGVAALVKAIRGEQVELLIDSGAALVTPANMADFE